MSHYSQCKSAVDVGVMIFYSDRQGEPFHPADSERSSGGNGGGFIAFLPGH